MIPDLAVVLPSTRVALDAVDQNPPFLYVALTAKDLPAVSADSAAPGLVRNLAYMNNQLVTDRIVVDAGSGYATTMLPTASILRRNPAPYPHNEMRCCRSCCRESRAWGIRTRYGGKKWSGTCPTLDALIALGFERRTTQAGLV